MATKRNHAIPQAGALSCVNLKRPFGLTILSFRCSHSEQNRRMQHKGGYMSHSTWMIYGATGTTGTLIAEAAIRRGHQPVLAGRSATSLAALGERLGLPWMAVGLDEPDQLRQAVSEVDAVLNAAGPFIATAPPIVVACLAA